MFRLAFAAQKSSLATLQNAAPFTIAARTATKKAGGTVMNKSDSAGRRLGVKCSGGEAVRTQNIIIRQRGFQWHPGLNVYSGTDHTLHAKTDGFVHFFKITIPGKTKNRIRTYVNVLPDREPHQEALINLAAQIKKKAYESLEYREGQREFLRQMRKVNGPFIHREEFIVDKGKERILSRQHGN